MRADESHFVRLWNELGLAGDPAARYDRLVELYTSPERHYHDLRHIADCLNEFDGASHLAREPTVVELALWFHDAIYDSHAYDNEARSAQLASEWMAEADAGRQLIERVYELILATRHDVVPSDQDTRLMVDIDRSILGQDQPRFQEYELQIRREYSWVPENVFTEKRVQILEGFLARKRIYTTDCFWEKYELQARQNLQASIKRARASRCDDSGA